MGSASVWRLNLQHSRKARSQTATMPGVWLLESEVGPALIESGPFCEGSRDSIRVKHRVRVVYQEDLDRLVAQTSADDTPLDPYASCGCPEVVRQDSVQFRSGPFACKHVEFLCDFDS